jgi:hypothetical protein
LGVAGLAVAVLAAAALAVPPARLAAARTPGLGSAIFLHIKIGTPTAGCVTLPVGELLEVLRWLNPAASPRIEMGVG